MRKKLLTVLAAAGLGVMLVAAEPTESRKRFIPTLHGVVRVDYELSTDNGDSRFQVQNARLAASGSVLPYLDYFLQVDFFAAGKVRPLDAYLTLRPTSDLSIMAGQERVPFCAEATRHPRDYYFVNTNMVNDFGNLRAVGIKAGYKIPTTPLYAEAGVFNASDMANHTAWNNGMTYGAKLNASLKGWKPEIGFMSRVPGGNGNGVRVNMLDASLSWKSSDWFVEAEYIYRHYTSHAHDASHVYSIFADYGRPMKTRMFNHWSVQARFDGQTACSNGMYNSEGLIVTTSPERQRVTVGATVSYRSKAARFDLRVNYEYYHYASGVAAKPDPSRVLAGAMLYF